MHILCPELAPVAVTTLLDDLSSDPTIQAELIDLIHETTSLEGFKFADDPLEGHEGCSIIMFLIQCASLPVEQRVDFIRTQNPQ